MSRDLRWRVVLGSWGDVVGRSRTAESSLRAMSCTGRCQQVKGRRGRRPATVLESLSGAEPGGRSCAYRAAGPRSGCEGREPIPPRSRLATMTLRRKGSLGPPSWVRAVEESVCV